jgi:hypothetical protein
LWFFQHQDERVCGQAISYGNVAKIAAKGARGGAIGVAADLTVRGTLSAAQECGYEGK